MTFIEAALQVLRGSRRPLTAEKIAEQAVKKGLIKESSSTARSMKARLTTDAKGKKPRVEKLENDRWGLKSGKGKGPGKKDKNSERPKEARGGKGKTPPKAAKTTKTKTKKTPTGESPSEKRDAERASKEESREKKPTRERKRRRRRRDGSRGGSSREVVSISPEEQAELAAADQALESVDYSDNVTPDEDRPFLTAIKREKRRERRHDRGRSRDESSKGKERDEPVKDKKRRARHATEKEVALTDEGSLLENIMSVLAGMNSDHAVSAKQLAQMMVKRRLLEGDATRTSADVKGALLRYLGSWPSSSLRYRGKGVFQVPSTGNVEKEIRNFADDINGRVLGELKEQLAKSNEEQLQGILGILLDARGLRRIRQEKVTPHALYMRAYDPDQDVDLLVAYFRQGPSIGRTGAGELRVGVKATGCAQGILWSPYPLNEDGVTELRKDGSAIAVECGRRFLQQLIDYQIGVRKGFIEFSWADASWFRALRGS